MDIGRWVSAIDPPVVVIVFQYDRNPIVLIKIRPNPVEAVGFYIYTIRHVFWAGKMFARAD
jgi:hypothetical protein